jgi:uncharacterized protein involved in type VI secretion and phage assembly
MMSLDNRKGTNRTIINEEDTQQYTSKNSSSGEGLLSTALENIYEQVQWQILIDGRPIKRIVSFELAQKFSAHHEFKLIVYHSELEDVRAYRIDNTKDLLGKPLTAMLGSQLQDDLVAFTGIITGISFRESKGLNGEVIVSGYSPTILLESGVHLHSFYNKNIQTITKEVTEGLAGKLEVAIKPRYMEQLKYMAQHQESNFSFLNRLCSWFGEWMYYDGRKLCIGKPDNLPKHKLYYVRHIEGLKMDMQVTPMNFSHLTYQSSEDKVLHKQPSRVVDGLNFYADLAVEKSDALFTQPVKNNPIQKTSDMGGLMHITDVNKATIAGSTFTITGICKVPYLTPAAKVRIFFGETELGEYLITEVSHQLTNGNQYTSTFKAVAGDINTIPTPILPAPTSEPQLAIVRKNDDPQGQGRVRVQFLWQEGDNMTDWIRVMSPDAGSGDKATKNRGLVFVPELGDQVMVGFQDGNASAPFVLGSMFHGKNTSTQGGGKDNFVKTIQTRSGHTLEFNDDSNNWSITIKDQSGNCIRLDTKGKNISISSPETIELNAKNIRFKAEENLEIEAKNMKATIKETSTLTSGKEIDVTSEEAIRITGKKGIALQTPDKDITLEAGNNISIEAKNDLETAAKNVKTKAKSKLELKSGGNTLVKGSKTDVEGQANKLSIS